MTDYADFAEQLAASLILTDPWIDGAPRFTPEPVVLDEDTAAVLGKTAEDAALLFDEAVRLALDDESVLADFYRLSPVQTTMFQAAAPLWHVMARADVFFTADGPKITELNSDTPTGQPEAVVTSALAATLRTDLVDPNALLCARFLHACRAAKQALVVDDGDDGAVGIVYPTELTEDLSWVRLWREVFVAAGHEVVLGSPYNLSPGDDGRVLLFGRPVSLVLRHYKTDWWSERESPWLDETMADPLPLTGPLRLLLEAELARKVAVVNPFGAVLAQNKRLMAFCWERIHRFSVRAQGIIERIVPYTARLEALHEEQLLADRENWVLKSDYGAEGDEVIIGRAVDDALWRTCLSLARPGRWVAQRFFEATADAQGFVRNHGVFIVAGRASGLYTRIHAAQGDGLTDAGALSAPTLVRAGSSTR
jgi:glutathionylspermidine synthase